MVDLIDTGEKPYPGLRSFERGETHIFFGRDETVADMVDRMAGHRFLAVTGYSGSGKSSLVKVGLLDALDRGLLVEAGSSWTVAEFTPGGEPFARLTMALTGAVERDFTGAEIGLVEAQLARGPKGLLDWLDDIDFPEGTNLLLLVDQFEEIFRYRQGRTGDDVNAFVQLLLASARQRKRSIYVVITMRSDFLGDCARFAGLAEQINDGQFLTPRLTRQQCRESIESPAAVFGGKVEPALVTRMLNDMGGNPDQLPLMQHVLMLLWDKAAARANGRPPTLTLADYDALGGIGFVDWQTTDVASPAATQLVSTDKSGKGALSDHADSVFRALTSRQKALAERLFRALTESRGGGDRAVRRPIRADRATAITETTMAELLPVVDAFRATGRNFLITKPANQWTGDTIIDISHESLIRQWGLLRTWTTEEQQSAETYRHIERGAKQWKKGRGSLLSRFDLAVARKWRKEERVNSAWAQRYGDAYDLTMSFLQRSVSSQRRRTIITTTLAVAVPLAIFSVTMAMMALAVTGLPYVNPANEWSNFDVAPRTYLTKDVGTNTSRALPGGRVIGTAELERAMQVKTLNGSPFVLLDVWHRTDSNELKIPGSVYIENAGQFGSGDFNDAIQTSLAVKLKELTQGKPDTPLVFYCLGTACWESYNAGLRAIRLGYTQVYWYRGGASAWAAAHRRFGLDFDVLNFDFKSAFDVAGEMFWALKQTLLPSQAFAFERGESYLAKQRYDFAIDNFADSVARNFKVADSYFKKAQAHHGKHEYQAALRDYNKAIALDPANKEHLVYRAQARLDAEEYDAAIGELRELLASDPQLNQTHGWRLISAYNRRGNTAFNAGKYDMAIADYSEALALNATDATIIKNRANTWYRNQNLDKAIADYNRAAELTPKDAAIFRSRADVFTDRNEFAKAIADYDTAIRLINADPQASGKTLASAIEQRAYAYYYSGDYARAVLDFVSAGRLDGDNIVYRTLFRYLARAKVQQGGTSIIELAADAQRLVNNGVLKKDAWPLPVFALLAGQGSPESVLRAAANANERCEAHYYAGQWHLLHGDKSSAIRELTAAAGSCKKSFFEYRAAAAELKRMETAN